MGGSTCLAISVGRRVRGAGAGGESRARIEGRIRYGGHRYGAFGGGGTGGQLRAQSAKAAGFRIPLAACDGGSSQADGADLLRDGSREILLRRMLAGRPGRADPGPAVSQRLRRHHCGIAAGEAHADDGGASVLDAGDGGPSVSGRPSWGLLAKRVYAQCDARDGFRGRADRGSAALRFQAGARSAALRGWD